MRRIKATDSSQTVRKWAKENKIGQFEVADPLQTKLEDIQFRLGYPYMYQHLADCQHLITFADARLLNKEDARNSKQYPHYSSVHKFQRSTCLICDLAMANWIVLESDRLPHSKCYLCDKCFKSYNFVDGKKVGNFKAYPYYDRSAIL